MSMRSFGLGGISWISGRGGRLLLSDWRGEGEGGDN
jgi:hypothetical protein